MYCANCGHPRDTSASSCQVCGAPLDPAQQPPMACSPAGGLGPASVPWRAGQVGWGLLLLILGALGAVGILVVLVLLTSSAENFNTALVAWLTSVLLGLVICATVWFLGLRPYAAPVAALGLVAPGRPGRAAALTVAALAGSMGATILYGLLVRAVGADFLLPPQDYTDIVLPGRAAILTFLALALWTPLTEEVFFRGFVFGGLVPGLGVPGAAIASALIFSGFHATAGLGVLIPIFITGLLLAWVYHQTGSLWASIAAHAGQNGVLLLVTVFGPS